ncbi:MAG: hypothetical protein JXB15_13055 [Anaerolineales bacterium]|nr:hypothetical protein [Anaerolineales bacterium]
MPDVIEPDAMPVSELPGIWSPVQWDLSEEEKQEELEAQATASLLWAVDAPEAILRLLLNEHEIETAFTPPAGYDPEQQGEWDDNLLTYQFKRPIKLIKVEQQPDYLYIEYRLADLGYWGIEIKPEEVKISRL